MQTDYRGGNSRHLAKSLDLLDKPLTVLDRRGQIVFVNSALCAMANLDATALVGKQCSWDIASDATPAAAILNAFAPPAAARNGHITARQLSVPIVFGSEATGQLFVPLLDEDSLVHLMFVVLGDWQEIQTQFPEASLSDPAHVHSIERAIADTRSRWSSLDGLHALLGESSAIRLAMSRTQLAISNPSSLLLYGPHGVGKHEIARAVFKHRLQAASLPEVAGNFFPIDCEVLDANLIEGMLEVFSGRLRPGAPVNSQALYFEKLQLLSDDAVELIINWLDDNEDKCSLMASSQLSPGDLRARNPIWQNLLAKLADIEIEIPALRHRRADIPALAQQAVAVFCREAGRALLNIAPEALDLLIAFPWHQNLQELNAALHEAVTHAVLTSSIQKNHLPVELRTFASSTESSESAGITAVDLDEILLDIERIVLRRALKLSPRNRAQVARWLNISRPRLLRRIKQLGLDDKPSDAVEQEDPADD